MYRSILFGLTEDKNSTPAPIVNLKSGTKLVKISKLSSQKIFNTLSNQWRFCEEKKCSKGTFLVSVSFCKGELLFMDCCLIVYNSFK